MVGGARKGGAGSSAWAQLREADRQPAASVCFVGASQLLILEKKRVSEMDVGVHARACTASILVPARPGLFILRTGSASAAGQDIGKPRQPGGADGASEERSIEVWLTVTAPQPAI
jgi:hypothetical protein